MIHDKETLAKVVSEHMLWQIDPKIGKRANLEFDWLEGIDMRSLNLENANLQSAKLKGANLSQAKLRGANLSNADLSNADLSWSELEGANLYGADLTGATLKYTKLNGTKLNGVKGIYAFNNGNGADVGYSVMHGNIMMVSLVVSGLGSYWGSLDGFAVANKNLRLGYAAQIAYLRAIEFENNGKS